MYVQKVTEDNKKNVLITENQAATMQNCVGTTYCIYPQGSVFLRYVGNYLQIGMALQPRRSTLIFQNSAK